ncbi:MAG: non-ribosomal peptide synthetase [Solimicrobium sp.]|nr:non-ribosomal peptide synthetase [Solimicrobium sp.]
MSDVDTVQTGVNSEQQHKLEKALLTRRKTQPLTTPERNEMQQSAPLSMAQRRLWLHETMEKCGALYNIPCALRLTGVLNVEALRQAINLHVQRHAVLRSHFQIHNGHPQQVCVPVLHIDLPLVQVKDEIEASKFLRTEADIPFNLDQPGLLRCHVLQLSSHNHILLITLHHIVSDGWSLGIMMHEISQTYVSLCSGRQVQLPELPMQYLSYSLWQRKWLDADRIQRQLLFWEAALQNAPELLSLPTAKPRLPRKSYQGDIYRFVIDIERVRQLKQLCRNHDVTLHMLLLASFNILLSRYSGCNDIVLGTPVANRFPQEAETLVGFFANTLAMRNQVTPELSFSTFLNQVKKNALAAYAHQDVPFDLVVEHVKPNRSQSHSPIFQVEFVLQKTMARRFPMGQLEAEVFPRDSSYTKFDLTLSMEECGASLYGAFEFNSHLFNQDFAHRLSTHFQALLDSIIKNPQQPIWSLDILSPAEVSELQKWSVHGTEIPVDRSVLDYFSDQVACQPHAVAICHNDEFLSYTELEQYANRLAHAMCHAGVTSGQRVALYLDRGIDYLIAMLATLKLGGVFVPFNPNLGPARNKDTLKRADPMLILVGESYATSLASVDHNTEVMLLQRHTLFEWPESAPDQRPVTLDGTAYIIFTSGSTGEPKGAMVTQRGMINHLLAKIRDLTLTENDAVAQIAVQTFDVSVWQFLAPLLVGARTQVFTGVQAWEPAPLLRQLQERHISVVETVPSHLEILLDEVKRNPIGKYLPELRWMISNGEPMAMDLCSRWFDIFPTVELMNAYGPTECSDDVTHLCLSEKPNYALSYLPIGRPIANASIYVLDSYVRPVPIGVTGEIHIGGVCVGQGYFRDEEKTRNRFVEDRFSGRPHARLYKSGDLGRYHSDGTLELLGRSDFQVKVRGCRIEPGEVEAALQQHPSIEQCLVMGIKDSADQVQLIAYVVPQVRPAPSVRELQAFCKQLLPDYMVPSGILFLDEFPLLSNGKLDRSQLAIFEPDLTQQYIAPRNATEASLALIWAEVINLQQVGVQDNFFHIGGHSLLAIDLVTRCKAILGDGMSLEKLFDYPTIEELVEMLSYKE